MDVCKAVIILVVNLLTLSLNASECGYVISGDIASAALNHADHVNLID